MVVMDGKVKSTMRQEIKDYEKENKEANCEGKLFGKSNERYIDQ